MKKGRKLSFDLMENMLAAPDAAEPEDENRRRMLRALRKAVEGELTPRQKECVRLLYAEHISQNEIAARLGVRPSTVSKHLKMARERLRRILSYYL